MAYYNLGNPDAPAILMGHSYLWDKTMWRDQFEALSSHFRLIVPDLWAHGESEGLPQSPTSIKNIADDNFQLMQKLGIDKFAVIGLSVGGMWGPQIALDHPENVTALIIMGTFVGEEPPESQAAYLGLVNRLKDLQGFDEELVEGTWHYFYSPDLSSDSPLVDEMKNRLRDIPKENVNDVHAIGTAIFTRKSNLEKLSTLQMPFAIMVGDKDIARVPAESELMAKVANTKNLHLIPNAGHISCLENPADVNQYLLNFLEK